MIIGSLSLVSPRQQHEPRVEGRDIEGRVLSVQRPGLAKSLVEAQLLLLLLFHPSVASSRSAPSLRIDAFPQIQAPPASCCELPESIILAVQGTELTTSFMSHMLVSLLSVNVWW